MALLHCHFFSDVLGLSCSMDVVLPQATSQQIGMEGRAGRERFPVLYLLHGLSDDHTIWQRRTSIERYVADLGLAVVMPAVERSFYTDMAHGLRWWTFISEELPSLCQRFFPLSDRREDTFVAGLSMGGYGAFKLALRHPERYAAAASLSGALDMAALASADDHGPDIELVYGDPAAVAGSDHDLLHLAEQVAAADGPRPLLYQWCGTDDFLYPSNVIFRHKAESSGLPLTYTDGPGDHQWKHWDEQIQRVLAWLPLEGR